MSEQPYRILIIEDSPEDREFYRRTHRPRNTKQDYVFLGDRLGRRGLTPLPRIEPRLRSARLSAPRHGRPGVPRPLSRGRSEGRTIPIVMLTGHGNEAVAVQAMKKGVHDYLVKGLNSRGAPPGRACGDRQGNLATPTRCATPGTGAHWRRNASRSSPNWNDTRRHWPRRTGAKTSSLPCSPTSCATRSPPSTIRRRF